MTVIEDCDNLDEGKAVDIVYLDFAKAFAKVPIQDLLPKWIPVEMRAAEEATSAKSHYYYFLFLKSVAIFQTVWKNLGHSLTPSPTKARIEGRRLLRASGG